MLKLENDALRDDVAAGRRRLHIKAVCQSVREATIASGVDNAASPWLADTAERDYFTLRERLINMQKQLKQSQKYINEQIERLHDGQPAQLLWAIYALPAEYKCLKYWKPSNPFTNVCWVSVFNNIFCAATNFGCIDSFAHPRTRKWWVMVSFGATAAGLFWTVNVCWAHPVISRARRSSE